MKKQKSKQGRKSLPLHQVKRNTNLFAEAGVIEQLGGLDATRAIAAAAIAAAVSVKTLLIKKYPCVDPLFEIKGCDMPIGSCTDCGGK